MIFFSQNKPPLLFSEGVILNLVGYCGGFLTLGLGVALIAAGFGLATAAGSAGFLVNVRFFFADLSVISTAPGLMVACLAAQASGESLCNPTQNPVELRPQPHFGGSLAGVNGIGMAAIGSGTLYGAVAAGCQVSTGSAGAGFLPVKKSIIFFNMLLSPILYL
jgi:hypothetical protein